MSELPTIMFLRRSPRRRVRKEEEAPTPPVLALNLIAAEYVPGDLVRLTFDRAIDIDAIDVAAIEVDDGVDRMIHWQGDGAATLVSPEIVEVLLVDVGPSTSGQVLLSASSANGIVATDDAGAWPGVADWVIPFP